MNTSAQHIAIYCPHNTIGMSATLIKDLCWVAAATAHEADSTNAKALVQFISADGKPVQCFTGNQLSVDSALSNIKQPDMIFIAAFWGSATDAIKENSAFIDYLATAHQQGIPIVATSNASFFVAEAGLLEHRSATVYPPLEAAFKERYPRVDLQASRAISNADNIFCANGIASGCDLIVAMIEKLFGATIARKISHDFLIGFNRNYSTSNVSFDGQKYHRDPQILETQQWLEQHYNEELSLEHIASDIGMSPRNFSRRFKLATGETPSKYLQRLRIEAAKELLRNSSLSIAEIAYKVGYSDLSYFSRLFKRHEQCSPHAFRDELE